MGNCTGICCAKEDAIVSRDLEFEEQKAKIKKKGKEEKNIKNEEDNLDIDIQYMKENEEKIIKMQANIKGHLTRKHMQKKNNEDEDHQTCQNLTHNNLSNKNIDDINKNNDLIYHNEHNMSNLVLATKGLNKLLL